MKFKDKVALVTGSSRGIGKAIALELAREGANIVVNSSKTDKEGKKVVEEIKRLGRDAIFVKCDVSHEEQVKKMVTETIKKFGNIDILVNNAGIVFDVPFFKKTTEEWTKTIGTNLMGPVFCSKYVAIDMKNRGVKGIIINISSTNGINCFSPDSMDYDITKAGVIMLTQDLAIELAPDIRVNCVAPGWVNTDMNAGLPKNFVDNETKKIYQKRFAQPEEIAKAVSFLASDDASFITGEVLKVDGGYGGWME